jgi:hypothetical protein
MILLLILLLVVTKLEMMLTQVVHMEESTHISDSNILKFIKNQEREEIQEIREIEMFRAKHDMVYVSCASLTKCTYCGLDYDDTELDKVYTNSKDAFDNPIELDTYECAVVKRIKLADISDDEVLEIKNKIKLQGHST